MQKEKSRGETNKNISLKKIFRSAVKVYESNLSTIFKILLVLIIYDFLTIFIENILESYQNNLLIFTFSTLNVILGSAIDLLILTFFINLILNKNIKLKIKTFITYLWATFLIASVFILGLILLIVPGIVWIIRSFFTDLLVIDKGLSAKEAIKESFIITKGNYLTLIKYSLVILLLLAPLFIISFSTTYYIEYSFVFTVASVTFGAAIIPLLQISGIELYKELSK